MKWILDPSFRYTPSYGTDLRKTFERIRRELQSQGHEATAPRKAAAEKVLRLAHDVDRRREDVAHAALRADQP